MEAVIYNIDSAWYFQEGSLTYMRNSTGCRWNADIRGYGRILSAQTQREKRLQYIRSY